MSTENPDTSAFARIDTLCDRFEAAWKRGGRPRIEDYLGQDPKNAERVLFFELLRLELRYRQREDEGTSRDEYRERFADFLPQVDEAFDTVSATRVPAQPESLRVRCPHCRTPIQLTDDQPLADIACPSCGSHFNLLSVSSTDTQRAAGAKTIAHFELIEQVGMGFFGTVWKAHDTRLDRTVAVKIARAEALDIAGSELFFREAQTAAQIRHPNVVSVHEVGRDGGSVYIVSDFIEGMSLDKWLAGQRLTTREAAELCAKIADAMHEAHEAGVVHRDLKPGNIMLDTDGVPYLTDFGLAKREIGAVTMTIDGQILGTPAYMSPEQARGKSHEADRRSDVYSLGAILYELLTGETPFRGEARMLIAQILRDEPVSPRRLNSRMPRDLETVCLKCLEKDPGRRYQTARDVADELRRFLSGESVQARPVGTIGRIWRWYRRHPDASLKVAGGYATFCAILLLLWGLQGLLCYASGITPSDDPRRGMVEIGTAIVGVYLPLLWAGVRTLNGSIVALWFNTLISAAGLCLSLSALFGVFVFATPFGDPALQAPLMNLFSNLCLLGLLAHVVAIVSHFLGRNSKCREKGGRLV